MKFGWQIVLRRTGRTYTTSTCRGLRRDGNTKAIHIPILGFCCSGGRCAFSRETRISASHTIAALLVFAPSIQRRGRLNTDAMLSAAPGSSDLGAPRCSAFGGDSAASRCRVLAPNRGKRASNHLQTGADYTKVIVSGDCNQAKNSKFPNNFFNTVLFKTQVLIKHNSTNSSILLTLLNFIIFNCFLLKS